LIQKNRRPSQLHASVLSTSTAHSSQGHAAEIPVLVTYRSTKNDATLKDIATHLKCSPRYLNSASELEKVGERVQDTSELLVLDASHVTTEETVNKLRQLGSIFIMHDDLDSPALESICANTNPARRACLFDLYTNSDTTSCAKRLRTILDRRNPEAVPSTQNTELDAGEWSHFVSLTFPSIEQAVDKLPSLRIGADAFELRIDLLEDQSVLSIHRQIAYLRDKCPLPIVYTVRSVGQIGKFPADPKRIFALLQEGLRAGAQWIDVEACWPQDQTDAFTQLAATPMYRRSSRLLGSLHVTVPQDKAQIENLFRECDLRGAADMLKVVTGAVNDDDCRRIHDVGAHLSKPYIGVCLGAAGSFSRVLNRRFTPVTHECMAVAAPGQLTVKELMTRRLEAGLLAPRQHFLFGTPIQQSLSPAMHNAAFSALSLPHVYSLDEQSEVSVYQQRLRDKAFGGASVTIPHKESIMNLLDEVRGPAQIIGAVNTVVREGDRLVGYNTDWLGIQRPILGKLVSAGNPWTGAGGLVVGAGGTARAACYAVQSLGLKLYVTNRSTEKGQELAKLFGGTFVEMEELGGAITLPLKVVVSTVPNAASFTLPAAMLKSKPVVLDVVYKPARTELIKQALGAGCSVIQGATMLLTQGIEQFELWNKRKAPFVEMEAAIFGGVERIDS